jgi:hypothetical protein
MKLKHEITITALLLVVALIATFLLSGCEGGHKSYMSCMNSPEFRSLSKQRTHPVCVKRGEVWQVEIYH